MNKKLLPTVLALFVSLCLVSTGLSMELGNKRKGKYTYRKVYKSCHTRGEVDSAKPPVNPDAKTQAEWKQTFENRQFDQFGCEEEWAVLSDKDLTDIFTYLYAHASDSPPLPNVNNPSTPHVPG